jgi:hypothetical protein
MMAITTSNSMSVNPRRFGVMIRAPFLSALSRMMDDPAFAAGLDWKEIGSRRRQ